MTKGYVRAMNPTLVYRVEAYGGDGPYDNGVACLRGGNPPNRPMPTSKQHGLLLTGQICGFKSMGDLLRWFDYDTLQELVAAGFGIATYTALSTTHGNKQLVFCRNTSTRTDWMLPC